MARRSTFKYSLVLLALFIPNLLWAAPPSRIFSYESGDIIDPSKVTQNEDAIFNYLTRGVDKYAASSITTDSILDGTLANSDIAGTAAIVDTKLAQITTASKVSGTSLTGLASVPSGAGVIPTANLTSVAQKGANSDITSITGLITPLARSQGGVGSTIDNNATGGIALVDIVWTDYSAISTIVGWTSFTTKSIYYKKIGKTVFVAFDLRGTSNSATTTFTVPYTSVSLTMDAFMTIQDNGGTVGGGTIQSPSNSATIILYKDHALNAFTNSGTKVCRGQFWYEGA